MGEIWSCKGPRTSNVLDVGAMWDAKSRYKIIHPPAHSSPIHCIIFMDVACHSALVCKLHDEASISHHTACVGCVGKEPVQIVVVQVSCSKHVVSEVPYHLTIHQCVLQPPSEAVVTEEPLAEGNTVTYSWVHGCHGNCTGPDWCTVTNNVKPVCVGEGEPVNVLWPPLTLWVGKGSQVSEEAPLTQTHRHELQDWTMVIAHELQTSAWVLHIRCHVWVDCCKAPTSRYKQDLCADFVKKRGVMQVTDVLASCPFYAGYARVRDLFESCVVAVWSGAQVYRVYCRTSITPVFGKPPTIPVPGQQVGQVESWPTLTWCNGCVVA